MNFMINDTVFAQNIDGKYVVMTRGFKRLNLLLKNKEKVKIKTDSIEIEGVIEEIRQFHQMSGFYKDQLDFSIKTTEGIKINLIVDVEGI